MDISDFHIADICICIVLACLWLYLSDKEPNHQYIPDNDSNSSYPYKNTGMSGGLNLTIVMVVPCIIDLIIYFIAKYSKNAKYIIPFDLIELLCTHIGCILFAGNVCHILKCYIGRPRPDYYEFTKNHLPEEESLREHEIREAFKSFPSGHSCTSASGSLFCTLTLIKVIDANDLWCIFLKMIPMMYAFYIGSMRIAEYRHHTDDVIAGLLIGFIVAGVFFFAASTHIFVTIKP